jgi:hypothetical protein
MWLKDTLASVGLLAFIASSFVLSSAVHVIVAAA